MRSRRSTCWPVRPTRTETLSVGAVQSVLSSNSSRTVDYTLVGGTLSIDPAQFGDLDDGESETVTVSYTITDGTATVTNTATLVVTGTNDAAVIGTPSVASVTEDAAVNGSGNLTASGSISISDADTGQGSFKTAVTAPVGVTNLGQPVAQCGWDLHIHGGEQRDPVPGS